MKKNFYYLSLLLGLVFVMTLFTACGGGDDDDDDLFTKKQEMSETQKTPETNKVWHTCNYCDGAKTDFNCNGTGKCQKCNGNGSYSEKCGICNGTGTLIYPSGPCHYCNATGQRTQSCSRCYSTGKCNICSGTGKCPTCKGEGGWYLEEKSYSEDSDDEYSSEGDDSESSSYEVTALCITVYHNGEETTDVSEESIYLTPGPNGGVSVYSSSSMTNFIGTRKYNSSSTEHGVDVSSYSYYAIGGGGYGIHGFSKYYYFN